MSARGKLLIFHRWLGISVGLYFALMALSGGYLVYMERFDVWLFSERHRSESATSNFDLEKVVSSAQAGLNSSLLPTRLQIPEDPQRNIIVTFSIPQADGKPLRRVAYVDPSNYRFKDAHDFRGNFSGTIFRLHQDLLLGQSGRPFVASAGISFAIILVSGLVLWWPKRKHLKRALSWPRLRAFHPGVYQLHRFLGFYSLPLLGMLVVSGVYLAKPDWFERAKEKRKEQGPAAILENGGPLELADLQQRLALYPLPLRPLNLSIDAQKQEVSIRIPSDPKRYRTSYAGGALAEIAAEAQEEAFSLKRLMHDLHAGHFWSWLGAVIVFLAMPLALFLSSSGFYLWMKRRVRMKTMPRTSGPG